MESMCSGRDSRPRSNRHVLRTAAVSLPLLLMFGGRTAWAQRVRVTGTVTGPSGGPLAGVVVRVAGTTDSAASTNTTGRYAISAPANGTLTFSLIGYQQSRAAINGRTTINVTMDRLAILQEVVVTSGYAGDAQRRSQITGAVGTVNVAATQNRSQASVVQSLDATVSGVTVQNNGSPGSRSTVRIRGISSFQNNDPLYIIDGTPVQDTYVNFLNPEDIASIQVLKDASAASIYGSRASNGVIIIQTRKGGDNGPPRTTLSVRTGTQAPYRGYNSFVSTDPMYNFQVSKTGLANSGLTPAQIQAALGPIYGDINNPTIPQYTYAAPGTFDPKTGVDQYGRPVNVNLSQYSYPRNLIEPGSTGTDWWKAVFGSAPVNEINLGVTGANPGVSYAVSGNYFDQNGTAAFNRYRRGSLRANTSLTRNRFTMGENLAVIGESGYGGLASDAFGEGGFLGKNILMLPIVPVYDVGGNYGGAKNGALGNNENPLQLAYQARNNKTTTNRFFGNVFASYDLTPRITFRTQLGGNVGQTAGSVYTGSQPQRAEAFFNDSYQDQNTNFINWTWSNTARYSQQTGRHNVAVLLGQEINRGNTRYTQGTVNNLISNDPNSLFVNAGIGTLGNPFSTGSQYALVSLFGKVDYTYNDRYVASVTVRNDGSSNLGANNRYGTFPAAGLAWHVSRESFLENNPVISDLQFRVGYGVTGNQQIPTGRTVDQYGADPGGTGYNVTGSGTLTTGYRLTALGNPNLKWESNRSVNAGLDLGLYNNNVTVIFDYFTRLTNNLLFAPTLPGTVGAISTTGQPFANVGAVKNAGFDFSVGHQGRNWSLTFNGSHYKNRITRIDGQSDFFLGYGIRQGNVTINQIGQPIGAFYGLVAQGFFRDSADVKNSPTQNGAAPGRIKFKDVNGDGQVTLADRTVIGDPNPKFTGGLDGTYRFRRIDLRGTVFGTFGNKVFDAQKQWYVFQVFPSAVRNDLLQNSWRPDNLNAKYPRLDPSDTFSRANSSYYVEDGSYVRLRTLQLGYTLPNAFRYLPAETRLYVQGENLFTITRYNGLDPALPPSNQLVGNDPNYDQRDQFRGVDQGVYPTSRIFSFGLTTRF